MWKIHGFSNFSEPAYFVAFTVLFGRLHIVLSRVVCKNQTLQPIREITPRNCQIRHVDAFLLFLHEELCLFCRNHRLHPVLEHWKYCSYYFFTLFNSSTHNGQANCFDVWHEKSKCAQEEACKIWSHLILGLTTKALTCTGNSYWTHSSRKWSMLGFMSSHRKDEVNALRRMWFGFGEWIKSSRGSRRTHDSMMKNNKMIGLYNLLVASSMPKSLNIGKLVRSSVSSIEQGTNLKNHDAWTWEVVHRSKCTTFASLIHLQRSFELNFTLLLTRALTPDTLVGCHLPSVLRARFDGRHPHCTTTISIVEEHTPGLDGSSSAPFIARMDLVYQ